MTEEFWKNGEWKNEKIKEWKIGRIFEMHILNIYISIWTIKGLNNNLWTTKTAKTATKIPQLLLNAHILWLEVVEVLFKHL